MAKRAKAASDTTAAIAETAVPKVLAPALVTFTAALSVRPTGTDRVEHFWPGLTVDLHREIAPGVPLWQALLGRDDCFEPAGDPGLVVADDPDAPRLSAPAPSDQDPATFTTATAEPGVTLPDKE